MQVEHRLARVRARVEDEPVARLRHALIRGHLRADAQQVPGPQLADLGMDRQRPGDVPVPHEQRERAAVDRQAHRGQRAQRLDLAGEGERGARGDREPQAVLQALHA